MRRKDAAARPDAEWIIFCGVHFMAESADILSSPHQKVILPDLHAGCSMADTRFVVSSHGGSTLEFWSLARDNLQSQKIATLALLPPEKEGALPNWVAWTPDGFYDGVPDAEKWLRFRRDGHLLAAAAFISQRRENLLSDVLAARS